METFSQSNFKRMPWKNGGGVTTELFCIKDLANSTLLFRLSIASVESDGPFSHFPGLDRILLLLEGKGFHLKGTDIDSITTLNTPPLYFKGEESITCSLIDGPCVDFNVMTSRSYAHSKVEIRNISENELTTLKADCDFKFIYDIEVQELYKLELGDLMTIKGNNKTLITIDVTKLK